MATSKPIFVATHPRACSTAFERVFMTRRDTIQTVHEPFGDAYYYGPERLAERYAHDEKARIESGFTDSTYKSVMDRLSREMIEGKRVLIKDMAQYLIAPNNKPTPTSPSLTHNKRGVGTAIKLGTVVDGDSDGPLFTQASVGGDEVAINTGTAKSQTMSELERNNPTVMPPALLEQFHFCFLIRHPKNSIPSYYRCCIPPLEDTTGFKGFRSDEAGYNELRRLFDYLRAMGFIGPKFAGKETKFNDQRSDADTKAVNGAEICVIDADDLLDDPEEYLRAFCQSVGIEFTPEMLNWDSKEEHEYAAEAFDKWKGFHEDAIESKDLKPREQKKTKTDDEHHAEWVDKYGQDGANFIKDCVEANLEDYHYLKQFCFQV